MHGQRCWTCRDRKIKCDARVPTCYNCAKARRVCKGYGVKLSWPRGADERRAIVLRGVQHPELRPGSQVVDHLLNVSSWDLSLADELENGRGSASRLRTMKVPRPLRLSPVGIGSEESRLLSFFRDAKSLILGPSDEENLSQLILRIAFSDPTNCANPVLQGILALASLHLHGSAKSFQYRGLVLSSITTPGRWFEEKILLQNLMGLMLLYQHELSLESNSKGDWVTFFCAVKRIINTSSASHKLVRHEYAVFLDWFYYHEVLAEFTVRHWSVPYNGCGFAPLVRAPRATQNSSQVGHVGCTTDVLQLVAYTCRRAMATSPPETDLTNETLEQMQLREQTISESLKDYGVLGFQSRVTRDTMAADLHRFACLIYVNRAVHSVTGTEYRHRKLVREGISLLKRMGTCQHAWPLFIVGCEAAEDDQRLAVLDVFKQTQQDARRRSSHIHLIQHLVQAVWNQCDLNSHDHVDYLQIFDAVVGSLPFMPLFA